MGWLTKPGRHARYGWKPDLPDVRDYRWTRPRFVAALPPAVDLRPNCPVVLDQGQLGSCTANAIANAHLYDQLAEHAKAVVQPSRLFIYYNERKMEGTINEDSGAQIRDGMKSIARWGVCSEKIIPYNIQRFRVKPGCRAYKDATLHQALTYHRLDSTNLDELRACLADERPFVFGFTVYESFESNAVANTGVVPMPGLGESVLGGHAVLCVGYDDAKQRFLVMNSWGTNWGMLGYFTIPYAYLTNPNLADDFWTVSTVEV